METLGDGPSVVGGSPIGDDYLDLALRIVLGPDGLKTRGEDSGGIESRDNNTNWWEKVGVGGVGSRGVYKGILAHSGRGGGYRRGCEFGIICG